MFLWHWLLRLYRELRHNPQKRPFHWPTREEIEGLPPFDALDLDRMKQLVEAKAVSQKAFDDARSANDAAQAALEGAKAQLAAAEEGRRVAQSKVAEAQGNLDTSAPIDAKIAAARANAALAHARVKSAEA